MASILLALAGLMHPSSASALNSDTEHLTELAMNEQTFPAGTDPEMFTFVTNERGARKYAPLKCGKMYTYQGTGGTFTLQRACTPGNRAGSPYIQWGIKLNTNNVRRAISPAKEKMFWKTTSMKVYQGLVAHNGIPASSHSTGPLPASKLDRISTFTTILHS